MKILVADDHAVVRKGLVQIIRQTPDLEVTAEADSGEEVLDLVRSNSFDIIVLDLNMPGMSGFQVIEQIKVSKPDLPILVLSMHSEEQYGVRVLRAGASGYIAKGVEPEKMIEAIRRVASGRRYISSNLAERLLDVLDDPTDGPPHGRLSSREFEVMRYLVEGVSVTEIGNKLHISVKTVSTYRTRILEKMDMSSNAELVQYAVRNGLVE